MSKVDWDSWEHKKVYVSNACILDIHFICFGYGLMMSVGSSLLDKYIYGRKLSPILTCPPEQIYVSNVCLKHTFHMFHSRCVSAEVDWINIFMGGRGAGLSRGGGGRVI